MIDEQAVVGLLDDIFNSKYNIAPNSLASKMYHLKKESDSFIMDNVYQRCLSAFVKAGEIIQEDPTIPMIMGVVNVKTLPVIVVVEFDEDRAFLTAFAKESLMIRGIALSALQKMRRSL